MSEKQIQPPTPENNDPSRPFRLDEVLTVISGTNFLDTADDPDPNAFTRRIGALTGYMASESRQVETFQTPRLAEEVASSILAQHPQLNALLEGLPPEPTDDASEAEQAAFEKSHAAWYERVRTDLADRMSEEVTLSPIDPVDHTSIDYDTEFRRMGGQTVDTTDEFLDLLNQQRNSHGAEERDADVVPLDKWAEQRHAPGAVNYMGQRALAEAVDRGNDEQVRAALASATADAARAQFHIVQPGEGPTANTEALLSPEPQGLPTHTATSRPTDFNQATYTQELEQHASTWQVAQQQPAQLPPAPTTGPK